MYLKLFSLPVCICRFYNVYGPYQLIKGEYCTVIGIFERLSKSNKPLTINGDGEQRRDFTHVDDIVDGLIKSAKNLIESNNSNANCNIFELGTGINYSINEIANMFGGERMYISGKKGEVRETLCVDLKAKEILNWKPKIKIEDYINNIFV